ncbi:MAG TPA: cystathionine beta-synthase, partial [Acidimicrobiaceae bacterium]|nr:cystathionine beta-synthase [Acidimicrobiaceae bacterium]
MVRLGRVGAGLACPVVAKLETTNPGGSVKDRAAVAMLDAAERDGLLAPGGTVIEPTSGNTGVGLAVVAAQRGYRCVFVVTDKMAPEKAALLRAYGAEVVVCPVAVAPDDPRSYYSTAERLLAETPGAFGPGQYHNPLNPQAHYDTTGPEIWRQTAGRVTHFVAGAGTGGTVSGVGRYLKEQNPDVVVVVADPEASVYSGGDGRPYLVEGIGEDFWPATYDPSLVDRVLAVSDAESFEMARRVTRTEGLLIGGSGGTAVCGALRVAAELDAEHLVVTLIPDSGRGYLSRVFDDEWMASMGFADCAADAAQPDFAYVRPDDTPAHALEVMRAHDLAAVPVAKGEMPVAAAEVIGSVSRAGLEARLAVGESAAAGETVVDVLEPALPQVGVGEPPERAAAVLTAAGAQAVVVFAQGRP